MSQVIHHKAVWETPHSIDQDPEGIIVVPAGHSLLPIKVAITPAVEEDYIISVCIFALCPNTTYSYGLMHELHRHGISFKRNLPLMHFPVGKLITLSLIVSSLQGVTGQIHGTRTIIRLSDAYLDDIRLTKDQAL